MNESIICAGFGGQGIMLLGKLITFGAMRKGLNTTWLPSYGAEVRGGTAHSMVHISDEDISSPIVSLCDTAIVMNQPSFEKFISKIRPKGALLLNTSLVNGKVSRKDISVLKIPMTETAHKLGNVKVANMVALGAYIKKRKLFSKDIMKEGIKNIFAPNKSLIDLNIEALEEGFKIR